MSRHATRRTGLVAVALLALGLVVATPAQGEGAGPEARFRTTGHVVDMNWLEVGTLPGVQGNTHFGYLWVQTTADGETVAFGGSTTCSARAASSPRAPTGVTVGGSSSRAWDSAPASSRAGT